MLIAATAIAGIVYFWKNRERSGYVPFAMAVALLAGVVWNVSAPIAVVTTLIAVPWFWIGLGAVGVAVSAAVKNKVSKTAMSFILGGGMLWASVFIFITWVAPIFNWALLSYSCHHLFYCRWHDR